MSEALDKIGKVSPLHPYYFDALVLRGRIHRALGNLAQAEADLTGAIALSKKPREALLQRGWLYCRQQRFEEALQDAMRAASLSEGHAVYLGLQCAALVLSGHIRRRTGDLDQAEKDLNRAVELSRMPHEALFERSLLRFGQQRFDDGFKDADRVAALCQGKDRLEAAVQESLMHWHTRTGNFLEATQARVRFLQCKPSEGVQLPDEEVFDLNRLSPTALREIDEALADWKAVCN
jgi:tetratricopeptide (TPR) repeat protein